ncbi:MAG: CARDB domain-containing protein [Thermodesulfovibrio sp.]|uniref:CARDB domain-containing protein n=1 Tax=unclassified Thermodesulfovibrio TaxID=2645936 RepID=UPI00083AB1A9|nr:MULTISPECIES: CARDB domain-containing protein [unclassified Thermodesulfovibrio]MDI1472517.1 CARDB domain-containing protein [Thermodesulfovibrio sp. 1176]MDI6714446.1 CARDB domain-containing protein [Thermodesulfovibrio sp.]ODA43314.1 hypothetical protein THER_1965 [Thermodesulfovibrio sp. N1]
MKRFYLLIILFILLILSNPIFAQSLEEWKISRLWTEPTCYNKLPDKDSTITVKAEFQCVVGPKVSKCQDITIKSYWDSSIERVERKINLTQAIINTCGPSATACTIMIDGEKMDVRILPGNKILISKTGFISPRLIGNVKLTLEAYTGVKLTDKKTITVMPCEKKPDLAVEKFEIPEIINSSVHDKWGNINGVLVIKNIGTAPSANFYVDVRFRKQGLTSSIQYNVPSINSGGTYTINIFIRQPEGDYSACAILDNYNQVSESNEENNSACRNFRIVGK